MGLVLCVFRLLVLSKVVISKGARATEAAAWQRYWHHPHRQSAPHRRQLALPSCSNNCAPPGYGPGARRVRAPIWVLLLAFLKAHGHARQVSTLAAPGGACGYFPKQGSLLLQLHVLQLGMAARKRGNGSHLHATQLEPEYIPVCKKPLLAARLGHYKPPSLNRPTEYHLRGRNLTGGGDSKGGLLVSLLVGWLVCWLIDGRWVCGGVGVGVGVGVGGYSAAKPTPNRSAASVTGLLVSTGLSLPKYSACGDATH